jgi:hypothetical protein
MMLAEAGKRKAGRRQEEGRRKADEGRRRAG